MHASPTTDRQDAEDPVLSEIQVNRVYLACGNTDMRKANDGLAVLVKEGFDLDPFSPALFVFCNRERNKLKLLYWEHNGFWLYYRRFERGRLRIPGRAYRLSLFPSLPCPDPGAVTAQVRTPGPRPRLRGRAPSNKSTSNGGSRIR